MAFDFSRKVSKFVFPDKPRKTAARYLVAVALPLLALAITGPFFTISTDPFFPLFTLSVILSALYGGWGAGLTTTAVSVLLNAWILEPRLSLQVTDPENVLRLAVFSFEGCLVSVLVGTIGSLQRKLEGERERLSVTLTSIGDAVMVTDREGRITFMNPTAEQTTGWSATRAMDRQLDHVFRIANETTRAPVENPLHKVFELGRVVALANHTLLMRPDGSEIPIDESAAPIRDAGGNLIGAVLVFRDISAEKKSEAALRNADKLASLGRLASTIAHEVNNPLEAVANLLFLIRGTHELADIDRYAETAERELQRASQITRHTLSFARRENEFGPVEVSELVDGILALYSNKIHGKNITVKKRCAAGTSAFASKSELRQVFSNLVGNAVDALPNDGTLHIRVRAAHCHGGAATRVVVADSGNGISAAQLPHIFDAFFTTKKDIGTGLGLWVTKQIVEAHGGCIHVRSRPGRGTVMALCWPKIAPTQDVFPDIVASDLAPVTGNESD